MPAQPSAKPAAACPGRPALPIPSGPSLGVTTDELLQDGPGTARVVDYVAVLLAAGESVALKLDPDPGMPGAAARFVAACARLGRLLELAGADAARLSVTVEAAAVSPMLAWHSRRSMLGAGRVDFILEHRDLAPPEADGECVRRRWFELWRLRDAATATAFRPEVRSACALLGSEPADAVLPPVGLQAPRDSAWLVYSLDVGALAARGGWPDDGAIGRWIRHALDDADSRLDEIRWPSARQAEDAWLNRRVAINVKGIGNVAQRCALDPGVPGTFVAFDRLLQNIRRSAIENARARCAGRDPLPAVVAADPCTRLAPGPLRDAWESRWQRLVDAEATVHRNLVVMSPWSLFPENDADVRYAALLPLLRHADACAFAGRPRLTGWRLDEFVDFHRRAWALCKHATGRPVVAEQP